MDPFGNEMIDALGEKEHVLDPIPFLDQELHHIHEQGLEVLHHVDDEGHVVELVPQVAAQVNFADGLFVHEHDDAVVKVLGDVLQHLHAVEDGLPGVVVLVVFFDFLLQLVRDTAVLHVLLDVFYAPRHGGPAGIVVLNDGRHCRNDHTEQKRSCHLCGDGRTSSVQ